MITTGKFAYEPGEHEAEKASNSYLLSLVAVVAGMPIPIVNLIATGIFFLGNRKGTRFVRWHCTQALLSQLSLFVINTIGFWWTISIVFWNKSITDDYIAYVMMVVLSNLLEFIATVYTSVTVRKGKHVSWWFYGELTNSMIKP